MTAKNEICMIRLSDFFLKEETFMQEIHPWLPTSQTKKNKHISYQEIWKNKLGSSLWEFFIFIIFKIDHSKGRCNP